MVLAVESDIGGLVSDGVRDRVRLKKRVRPTQGRTHQKENPIPEREKKKPRRSGAFSFSTL
jgi:hypothetical protein